MTITNLNLKSKLQPPVVDRWLSTFGYKIKRLKRFAALAVALLLIGLTITSLLIWRPLDDDPFGYQGTFDPKINRMIVLFFNELSQGSGYAEAGGYPGGLGVYPHSGGIIFTINSEAQELPGYLLLHFPHNWDEPNREDSVFGDFAEYDGVVPACFSFMRAGVDPSTDLRTTYRLGEDEIFDSAFVRFVDALGTDELLGRDWGAAYKTLSEIRERLEKSKALGKESALDF